MACMYRSSAVCSRAVRLRSASALMLVCLAASLATMSHSRRKPIRSLANSDEKAVSLRARWTPIVVAGAESNCVSSTIAARIDRMLALHTASDTSSRGRTTATLERADFRVTASSSASTNSSARSASAFATAATVGCSPSDVTGPGLANSVMAQRVPTHGWDTRPQSIGPPAVSRVRPDGWRTSPGRWCLPAA